MTKGRVFLAKFMHFFGYFMALIYIGLGASLFLKQVFPSIPEKLKIAFALFFIAYGVFRFARLFTQNREE
jgi:hypothetical protein